MLIRGLLLIKFSQFLAVVIYVATKREGVQKQNFNFSLKVSLKD